MRSAQPLEPYSKRHWRKLDAGRGTSRASLRHHDSSSRMALYVDTESLRPPRLWALPQDCNRPCIDACTGRGCVSIQCRGTRFREGWEVPGFPRGEGNCAGAADTATNFSGLPDCHLTQVSTLDAQPSKSQEHAGSQQILCGGRPARMKAGRNEFQREYVFGVAR